MFPLSPLFRGSQLWPGTPALITHMFIKNPLLKVVDEDNSLFGNWANRLAETLAPATVFARILTVFCAQAPGFLSLVWCA